MKKAVAPDRLIQQYQYEVESWGRLLLFQKEELVYCKNRLAEVINGSAEGEELLVVERFQEEFLAQERVVEFLSMELKKQARLIEKEIYLDGQVFGDMQSEQKKLRREFRKAEELFTDTKNKFVQFLSDRY